MAKKDTSSATVKREPRTNLSVGWDPEKIRSAELMCGTGNLMLAADLCEAMMPDARVSKCLDRLYAATTLPLTFELPGKDAKESKQDPVCQALEADWWKMFPESKMRSMVAWLGTLFAVLMHIDGWEKDQDTGRVLPKISVWNPRNLRNDPVLEWMVRVAGSSGDSWGAEERITPGDGNWVLIILGDNYRAMVQAPWFGIAPWWLLGKRAAPIDWASSSERHGQGQTFISNTMSAGSGGLEADTGEELSPAKKLALATDVSASGRNGVVVFPRGWKGDLVTDGAKTYETFQAQKDAANSEIDMGLLGTNLTTEVNGGSYSAAQVHASVDAAKMRGLLEAIATGLREQVIKYWHRYNFATGVAPYPHWDTTPPKDVKAEQDARKSNAEALDKYVSSGAQIDQIAWFEGEVRLIPGATREIKKPVAPSPIAQPVDPQNPDAAPKDPAKPAKKTLQALALSADTEETALQRGHGYLDRLDDECVAHAAKELAPMVASIVSAIEDATDYEDAKARIKAAFGDALPPNRLLKLTEQALIMAQMAGRETIEQELATEE